MTQGLFSSLLPGLCVEDPLTVAEDGIQRCPRLLPQLHAWHRFSILYGASRAWGMYHPPLQGLSQGWLLEEALPTQKPLLHGLNSLQGFWTLAEVHRQL